MMTHRLLLATALAAAFVAPAYAQQAATLRIDSGSAMISSGGEFSTAASGTQVTPGMRVMLAEGSQATLIYPGGCSQALSAAGVYGVPATCVAAASPGSTAAAGSSNVGSAVATGAGVDLAGLGIVAGLAAAGAVGLDSMDEVPAEEPPPVSR